MENKKLLGFPLFPGRNCQISISNSINTLGAPHCSMIRFPFYILSSALVTSLFSSLLLTWHVLHLPALFSTLYQYLHLALLPTEINF